MKRRFAIIVNPAAGNCSLDHVEEVCRAVRQEGHEADFRVSQYKGNCTELTRDALAEGVDAVVAAGGDGTVNEIANVMAGTGVPMAVFPRGSVNILAMEIGLQDTDRAVVECLLHGHPETVSLGRIDARYFVLMAGVGVDARAVAGVTEELKEKQGKSAYVRQVLAELRHPPGTRFRVETVERTVEAASVVVCNAKRYAGAYKMAPQADLHKPRLAVCTFQSGRLLPVLRYNLGLALGLHTRFWDVHTWETARVGIQCLNEREDPIQVDGDAQGQTPCTLEAAPDVLEVLVPPHRRAKRPGSDPA